MKQNTLALIAIFLVSVAPALYFFYVSRKELAQPPQTQSAQSTPAEYVTIQYSSPKAKDVAVGEEFGLLTCRVIDGCIFMVQLDNGQWIEGRLVTATKDEATAAVIEALKPPAAPRVLLKRKIGTGREWVVDFSLTIDGKKTTLMEWLKEKKLTL